MLKRSFLIALLVSGLLAPSALARTTVHVDRSFGVNGTVEGKFGPAYWPTAFTAIAPQPDGSLLATRGDGVNPGGWIRRYAADGSPDPGFPAQPTSPRVEAVDAEGRLLLRSAEQSLERLNSDGTPDPSFGVRPWGAQKVSDPTGFRIEQIVPLPSGKILVAGSVMVYVTETSDVPGYAYVEQVAVARFEPEGALDATFGNGGVVRLRSDVGVGGETLLGIEPRPGGGVAVVVLDKPRSQFGPNAVHSPSTFVALDAGGHLDPSFAAATVRTPDTIEAFDVLADGSVTLAGERWGRRVEPPYEARLSDVFVSRYTAAGQADPGFGGGDGSIVFDLADIDVLGAALWEDDGSIWLGGASSSVGSANCRRFRDCPATPFLVRLTAAGAPDAGFDGDGILLPARLADPYGGYPGGGGVLALAARPGGGVYAGGASGVAAFIAAVLPNGAFDPAFANSGILTETEPRESNSAAHAIATDRRGRLLVAGSTGAAGGGPGALFRFLRNGQLDRGFAGGRGFVRLPGQGRDLALAADGGAFVFAGGDSQTVTKVGAAGRVDPSYGEEGTTLLPVTVPIAWRGRTERLFVEIASIAALPGGRLLLAGTASNNEARALLFRLRADGSFDPSFGRGGTVIRSFGNSGRCRVNQMALQRDGRILLAGQVERGPNEPRNEALAVMRLLANGKKDRSFGRRGLVVKRLGQRSYAGALAVQGRRGIVVAGRSRTRRTAREVLLRLRPDGRLDRGFGRRGIAGGRVPLKPGGYSNRPRQILFLGGRILILRDFPVEQLVGFSADGRRRRTFVVARGTETDTRVARAPFGALQGNRLVLGWQVFDSPTFFKLQRLQIQGRP